MSKKTEQQQFAGSSRRLIDVVREVMEKLGGRAPIHAAVDGVKRTATYAEWTGWADAAVTNAVRAALRVKGDDGLPEHLSVEGQYVALSLFSIEQYTVAAKAQARRGGEFFASVWLLQAKCREVHGGETFDAQAIIDEVMGRTATG